MTDHGHYGLPAIRIAAASVGALLLHLLLPYGVVRYGGPAAPPADWLSRGDVMALRHNAQGLVSVNTSPDVVLAGLIIAAAAGVFLAVMGFQPLQVTAARWIGTLATALVALGAGLAWMGSMYSVGTGFSALLGVVFPGDFRAYFFAFGPVVTASLAAWVLFEATRVSAQVVSTRDGLREGVQSAHKEGLWAMAFIGAVLLVPWSIGILPDGVSDALGQDIPSDGTGAWWFSAEDLQSATPAELSWRVRYAADGEFAVPSLAIHAFLAFGWAVFTAGWLQAIAGTACSVAVVPRLFAGVRFTRLPVALLGLWAGVMYVLAWIFVKPDGDVDHTFLPAFLPLLVLVPLLWLGRRIGRDVGALLAPRPTALPE